MVWDKGTYKLSYVISAGELLARGKIELVLQGKKLRGGFVLVQTETRSTVSGRGKRWLLIKRRDEHADPAWDIESPELNRSVLTGRTLEEIEVGSPKKR